MILYLGGAGRDHLFGGAGSDCLHGGWGHDVIRPGSGDDRMRGEYGSAVFILGSGFDMIEDFRGDKNDKIVIMNSMNYLIM